MDGHLRVDDLVDATRHLVTVESPTDDLIACAEVVEAAHELSRAWLSEPGRIERHGGRPVWRWGPSSPRVLLSGIWTRCGRWEPWSRSRSRWTEIE